MIVNMEIFIIMLLLAGGTGQLFEDRRCRCVCPSPASVLPNSRLNRQIYTGNVPPANCNCAVVVAPIIGYEIRGKEHLLCPRCDCFYQTRNTNLIMGVVLMLLLGLSFSILRMITMWFIKNFVLRPRPDAHVDGPHGGTVEETRILLEEEDSEED